MGQTYLCLFCRISDAVVTASDGIPTGILYGHRSEGALTENRSALSAWRHSSEQPRLRIVSCLGNKGRQRYGFPWDSAGSRIVFLVDPQGCYIVQTEGLDGLRGAPLFACIGTGPKGQGWKSHLLLAASRSVSGLRLSART